MVYKSIITSRDLSHCLHMTCLEMIRSLNKQYPLPYLLCTQTLQAVLILWFRRNREKLHKRKNSQVIYGCWESHTHTQSFSSLPWRQKEPNRWFFLSYQALWSGCSHGWLESGLSLSFPGSWHLHHLTHLRIYTNSSPIQHSPGSVLFLIHNPETCSSQLLPTK